MKAERVVPEETRARQETASDPRNSAWVSANAGSGKTHVLSQRVIRLLLGRTDPARILCLTYTRAAAANMSSRVFRDLAAWTSLSDAALSRKIAQIEGRKPKPDDLTRARTLFATALETPGGLKVQTIHAFCESLLHQFPLEANIAAHFQMLDPRMEAALIGEARRDMISGAARNHDAELTEAFATVLESGGEFGLDQLLTEIVAKRDKLRAFIAAAYDGDGFQAISSELGLRRDETPEAIADAVWPLPGFDVDAFGELVRVAEQTGAAKVQKDILPNAIAGFEEADPIRRLELLAAGFLRKDGDPYDPGNAFTKKMHNLLPDLAARYMAAASALIAAVERLALARMAKSTRAAVVIADRLIARYEALKAGGGFLDFNDLITRTVRLLGRADVGAWVQYKLDRGIDHVLIDEAQDTSPEQWQVVNALTGDFFSGAGARGGLLRTVFAVGDEKQSIYSFQGASPDAFGAMGSAFGRAVEAGGKQFEKVSLQLSFRSTRDVLYAVDRVFDDGSNREGVSGDGFTHDTIRVAEPGYVEVWPYVGAQAVTEPEDWREAIDHAKAPAVQVAEQVANTIRRWIDNHELLEGANKRVRPGDIMILVRKRDRFVHALSRALKARQIPVAGTDRLLLASHIAVKDLIALGRWLLQSQDDLSLAAVLKSPLFGLDEDRLFHLAHDRPATRSLGEWMRQKAAGDASLQAIVETLDGWATDAAFKPAFEFYSGVLCAGGTASNRSRFIGRLGHQAGEILDEFLSFCLAEEAVGLPGLEDLLTTLETAGPEIKREMDQHRDEVRILTVHASKGLEAPVVFLVDSGGPPSVDAHLPRLMPFQPQGDQLRGVEGFLWRSSKDVANARSRQIETDLKRRAEQEYRRLLYVGMTRAEDRLIVCGYYNIRRPKERTWMSMIQATLAHAPEIERIPHPVPDGEEGFRFRVTPSRPTQPPKAKSAGSAELPLVPAGLAKPLPMRERLPRPLTPSGAAAMIEPGLEQAASTQSPVLDPSTDASSAAVRGKVYHKLLQVLPEIEPAARRDAAQRYFAHAAGDWSEQERTDAWERVADVLEGSAFAPIFAPGSRAEVSVMGTITVRGRDRVVSGQMDRLAVTDSDVLIVDYKTNRVVPDSPELIQSGYVLQLALYAELMKALYPGHNIRAAVLYTEGPRILEVPADLRAAALARLTQA